MSDSRYHVHVCLVRGDQPDIEDAVVETLSEQCFFTWDFYQKENANNYTRKQLDSCDYVLLVLGNSYGQLSASGVSYLHLNYVYANTKHKPMLCLIKTKPQSTENPRQLRDFRSLIQKEYLNTVFYSDEKEFSSMLKTAFRDLKRQSPKQGWQPALPIFGASSSPNSAPKKPPTAHKTGTAPSKARQTDSSANTTVEISDVFNFRYKVHAYQEGNFKELVLEQILTWGEILAVLTDVAIVPVVEDSVLRQMNDFLNSNAMPAVKAIMPFAHAVARAQIDVADFKRIKDQLLQNEWLKIVSTNTRGRNQVQVTDAGVHQLRQWQQQYKTG